MPKRRQTRYAYKPQLAPSLEGSKEFIRCLNVLFGPLAPAYLLCDPPNVVTNARFALVNIRSILIKLAAVGDVGFREGTCGHLAAAVWRG
jgi:hypothetical protein